ncbi:HdeD family acid-resistance protein [Phenylobacterium sp. LjRoot219]|uniref:HdeD family acid-resistance protein n=1 Tax=Phenylobacterium sp. LjRoot219 TaxID=3342283 RepID=UPI003ED08A22
MTHAAAGVEFLEDKRNAMTASLARNWWAVALRGLVALAFGVVALFMPGVTLASLVLVFAAYMLADGVLTIVAAVRAATRQERWGLLVLEGLADLATGAIALLMPKAALFAFIILAAAWAVVSGVLMLSSGFKLRADRGRIWQILGGFASIAWGVLLLLFPAPGLLVLTWWLGAYALLFGATLLALGISLRFTRNKDPAAA